MPLIWIERFSAAASNQPQRRGRPVTDPNSFPRCASYTIISATDS